MFFPTPRKVNLQKYKEGLNNPGIFYGLNSKIEFCKLCTNSNQKPNSEREYKHVKQTNKPTIKVEKGICNACKVNDYKKENIDWEKREKQLKKLCDKFRKNNGDYDCLIPGSGGKDSFYVSHVLKHKYGMNPLTLTFSPHLYTDWGFKNFKSWIQTGFDNYLFTPNPKIHRLLTRISLENLFHPFQPFIFGQNFLAPKLAAKQFNIKLVFMAESPLEYGNDDDINDPKKDPKYFCIDNPNNTAIGGVPVKELIKNFNINANDLVSYLPISTKEFAKSGTEVHYLGFYLPWHPQEIFYYAMENGNFSPSPERTPGTYSKYSSIDDKMDDLHYFTTFIKFGIGRATHDSSHEVRNGEISREEAVNLVKKFDGEYSNRFEKEIFEYLSINEHEFKFASKNFQHPTMDKKYFDLLTDNFRSPHIWKFKDNKWELRSKVWK